MEQQVRLTARQKQILTGVCQGKTDRAIAYQYGISKAYVRDVLRALALKFGLRGVNRAVLSWRGYTYVKDEVLQMRY